MIFQTGSELVVVLLTPFPRRQIRHLRQAELNDSRTFVPPSADRNYVIVSNFGSDAILVQLRLFRTDEPCLKQIDFSAAIHLPFDELEACDLAFRLSV